MNFAKFWQRILASMIDNVICLLTGGVLAGFSGYVLGFSLPDISRYMMENVAFGSGIFLFLLMRWLYFTLFESSEYQTTPGKMVFGIKITDKNGSQISFGRANIRYWSKTLSLMMLGFGFLLAAFTKKKQGLHDLIAKTLVLKNN